jgi:hypothetical protein
MAIYTKHPSVSKARLYAPAIPNSPFFHVFAPFSIPT